MGVTRMGLQTRFCESSCARTDTRVPLSSILPDSVPYFTPAKYSSTLPPRTPVQGVQMPANAAPGGQIAGACSQAARRRGRHLQTADRWPTPMPGTVAVPVAALPEILIMWFFLSLLLAIASILPRVDDRSTP